MTQNVNDWEILKALVDNGLQSMPIRKVPWKPREYGRFDVPANTLTPEVAYSVPGGDYFTLMHELQHSFQNSRGGMPEYPNKLYAKLSELLSPQSRENLENEADWAGRNFNYTGTRYR